MENKNEGNESKIILGDFNCTMDKKDRYDGNKTQRLYKSCSYYNFNVDNRLRIYGEKRSQIPEFMCYGFNCKGRSRIDRVYNDIKIAKSTKGNHIMVSFTDHYNAISID